MKLELNIEKKHLYYLIGLLVFVSAIAIAQAPNPGHAATDIGEGTIAGTLTISNNKVGIGVSDPVSTLSLPNTANIAWKASGSSGSEITSIRSNSDQLEFITNGLARAVITSGGNVGIGTTSPGSKLEVAGNAKVNGWIRNSDGAVNAVLAPVAADGFMYLVTASDHGLSFGTNNVWSRMVISNTGNVGIGITNPGAKLHVTGGDEKLLYMSKTASGTPIATFEGGYIELSGGAYGIRGSAGNAMYLGANGQDFIYITTDGKVGIGTTSPGYKLSVANGYLKVDSNAAVAADFVTSSGKNIVIGDYGTGAGINFNNIAAGQQLVIATGGNSRMNIDNNGNIGIPTLAGSGNAYVCTDATGRLYRSATACS